MKSIRSAVIVAVGSSFKSARPIVDLPDPLSPTIPSRSRPRVKETFRTACIAAGPAPVGDAEVAHIHQRFHQCRPFRCLGSSASRRPSPIRLKARLTQRIAAPGKATSHQLSSM